MSEGRVALVTGAGRGIGSAIAQELGSRGYRVLINYQSSEGPAQQTAESIRAAGGTAEIIRANVSDPEQVKAMFEKAEELFGPVEVLVNNAGITRDALLMRMKDADWDAVIQTNLTSFYLCTKAVIRQMMKARFGRIISISSVVGLIGNAGQANYAAAKAGVIALMKSAAREGASRGITANAVAPGLIETDMTRELPETAVKSMLDNIPAGTIGKPSDVAHAVAFLASDEASYINGQVIAVDGGMTM